MNDAKKSVLLIITGGIAAYKSLLLIRLLVKAGIQVQVVMTKSAENFVTPLSVESLTGTQVYRDLFELNSESGMGHIELSRMADLIVVAPATADIMAKAAHGLADDLASTLLLATDTNILYAPAMNVRMWLNPAVQENVQKLQQNGAKMIDPDEGEMACGEFGPGRMSEPDAIFANIETLLKSSQKQRLIIADQDRSKPLSGKRILITSGPTREPLDPVRYLSNHSSGKQGTSIAEALVQLGADVQFVTGPAQFSSPHGADVHSIMTAQEMLEACLSLLPVDAVICVAAVVDWQVRAKADNKLKKQQGKLSKQQDKSAKQQESALELTFVETPDILATLAQLEQNRPALVVGFAAETENVIEYAKDKRERKGCDWIIANDVSAENEVFHGSHNQVHIIADQKVDTWPRMSKEDVAKKLSQKIVAALV